jgi:hypothetical protein
LITTPSSGWIWLKDNKRKTVRKGTVGSEVMSQIAVSGIVFCAGYQIKIVSEMLGNGNDPEVNSSVLSSKNDNAGVQQHQQHQHQQQQQQQQQRLQEHTSTGDANNHKIALNPHKSSEDSSSAPNKYSVLMNGAGDPHLINLEAHRAERVRDRGPIENKNVRVITARIVSVSSGARTAVGGGGGEGSGERASKHSTSSAPSSSRVSDSGGTSSGTINYHSSSSSSSNSSNGFSCFGSSSGSKSVEHNKYSVNKYLTSNSNNCNSNNSNNNNNSSASNASYRDSTSIEAMPNPHVSSSNLTSFPTLDPHVVQVMRPHQLEAATWLLNILMGNAEVNEKKMETVKEMKVEKEVGQRKEDAAGVMMITGTGKDERQLMEERLETGEVRGASECQPLSPSLPLTGAILADDMGTGKVIRTNNIACVVQHHTTLCRTVSCCCCSALICPILNQFFAHYSCCSSSCSPSSSPCSCFS